MKKSIDRVLVTAILVIAAVAGYFMLEADGPSYPLPWAAYAFNVGRNELEFIGGFSEYKSREEIACMP